MELHINYDTLLLGINEFIKNGFDLKEREIKTESEFEIFEKDKKEWENQCIDFIKNSFSKDASTFYLSSFKATNILDLGYKLPIEQQCRNLKNDLISKINLLEYIIELLKVSDAIINPEIIINENRSKWKIQQKKVFLLQVLKKLNGKNFHNVDYIFSANGIVTDDTDENRDIADSLSDEGYLIKVGGKYVNVKITLEGKEYLESLDALEPIHNTTATSTDMTAINIKLDEVIEWLKKNDMGNEIIFNEIQELKDAGDKLDLKNWKQLVKGKLLDLTMDATIGFGIDAAKHLFKELIGGDITKLIK